jgi:CHAD domain-containing protein
MKLKAAQSASENARVVLPKMASKYFHAGRKAIGGKRTARKLHAFRLVTKRFRYTLELFRPVYGPQMDRYLKGLRNLQSALGKVSDLETIQDVLPNDRELGSTIERALKGKLRDLHQRWRAFDSDGELKRWRTYLAGDHSQPRPKRQKPPAGARGSVKKRVSKPRT